MARDDLLDQGRARARHADDQNWRLVVPPYAAFSAKNDAVKRPIRRSITAEKRCPVETSTAGPSEAVGRIEMAHRLSVLAQIVMHLADGKMQEHAVAVVMSGPRSADNIRASRGRSASLHLRA